jgi:hypothetical protein
MTTGSTPSTARGSRVKLDEVLGGVWRAVRTITLDTVRAAKSPRLLRELAPLVVPLAVAPWLAICVQNYAHGNVWRDTTLLNYASWCMLHGDRIYSTVSMMDGPLAFISHAILVLVGGFDESAWRQLDLVFHVLVGGAIGVVLAPRARQYDLVRKTVWFVVGASMWLTALSGFDFPASLQREAHYAGLGLLGIALVYRSADSSRRKAAVMICVGALLAGWTPWGKQTAGIYMLLAVLTAWLLPKDPAQPRWWRMRWAAIGVAISVVSILGFVAIFGSLKGLWTWFFAYNLDYYRFHDVTRYRDIVTAAWGHDADENAVLILMGGIAAIAVRALPARALAFVIAPMLELGSVVLQHKGWRYQFIPTDFCAQVCLLLALAQAWSAEVEAVPQRMVQGVAAVALSMYVAYTGIRVVESSVWLHEGESHLTDAATTDPIAAAKVLAEHTRSEDKVFHFGDEPAVLLFARRHPATQYIVPWMIDLMRHVTVGGDNGVTPAQEARIRALEAHNQKDDCAQVLADPPPALVFKDGSVSYPGTISDVFYGMCPAFKDVVAKRYHELKSGPFHIMLRDDRP